MQLQDRISPGLRRKKGWDEEAGMAEQVRRRRRGGDQTGDQSDQKGFHERRHDSLQERETEQVRRQLGKDETEVQRDLE